MSQRGRATNVLYSVAAIALAAVISFYFGKREGLLIADIRLQEATLKHEQATDLLNKKWELEQYDLQQEAIAKDVVIDSLHSSSDIMQQTIRDQRAELSDSAAKLFAAQNRTSDVLSACIAEYQQMAKDADGVVEALRAGQKWHTIYIIK